MTSTKRILAAHKIAMAVRDIEEGNLAAVHFNGQTWRPEVKWQPIKTAPDRPMVVLFYSLDCRWLDQDGREHVWPPERDEKYSLGFWDGHEWFWMGTAHRVFEVEQVGHPDMPSHWSPVLSPPVSSGQKLADATPSNPPSPEAP